MRQFLTVKLGLVATRVNVSSRRQNKYWYRGGRQNARVVVGGGRALRSSIVKLGHEHFGPKLVIMLLTPTSRFFN
jgi:hypothetical protein